MLVDDHAVFRQGLQTALGDQFRIVGEAVEGGEAVDKAVQLKPDVVIMDVSMPGMNGVAATRGIKERLPDAQVVIVTAKDDDATLLGAIEAGACAFVPKHESLQVLLDAVKQASQIAALRARDRSADPAGFGHVQSRDGVGALPEREHDRQLCHPNPQEAPRARPDSGHGLCDRTWTGPHLTAGAG